jgi:polyhydroxyalkanoate synthesis regulator phasin
MDTQREPMLGEDGMSMTTKDMRIAPEAATGQAAGGGADPMAPPSSENEEEEDTARRSLLRGDSTASYRERWQEIQASFVDEPRTSVQEADRLVVEVIQELQSSFTSERETLEAQWQRGDDVETEDLRVAFQRYRSFFDRLLAA